jgi:type VI secretion system FHA domain protein
MELLLTLENGGRAVEDRQRRLHDGRLSIGRAADSDWVLPDPERLLSKHHCVVEHRDGAWFLTDTSANGVFVANSPDPLGKGGTVQLQDGLRLRLGDYVLAASLVPDDGPGLAAFTPATVSPPLFDQTWYRGRSLDLPQHPVASATPGTRSDHAPPHQAALDLPRRVAPFDDVSSDAGSLPEPKAGEHEARSALPDLDSGLNADAETPAAIAAPQPPPPPVAPPPEPVATQAAETGMDAGSGLAAFLDGAGLAAADAGGASPEALLHDLGRRYRAMAEGLIELLMIRSALKRETGLDRTMIAGADNNPLKLTASAEEAARWLVTPRGRGYLDPDAAIAATIDDLKAFAPELVRSMQQALQTLLHRIDPAGLERVLGDIPMLQIIAAGGRKAAYWDRFKERYGELAREAEREFLHETKLDAAPGQAASGRQAFAAQP